MRFGVFLSIVSAVTAIAVVVIGYLTLVATTRAWVGPSKATISIDDSGVVTIEVTYKNVGKEPAVEFGDDWADDWAATINTPTEVFDFYNNCTSDGGLGRCGDRAYRFQQAKCEQKGIFQDRVAFPDFQYRHIKSGLKVDKTDRNRIVVVQGCFVYKSNVTFYGSVHRSAFCYYYRVGQVDPEMRACPVGNSAT